MRCLCHGVMLLWYYWSVRFLAGFIWVALRGLIHSLKSLNYKVSQNKRHVILPQSYFVIVARAKAKYRLIRYAFESVVNVSKNSLNLLGNGIGIPLVFPGNLVPMAAGKGKSLGQS